MITEINHVYEKLDLKIGGQEYFLRLDVTKKTYGGCHGERKNFKMILENIRELREKKGFLEAKAIEDTTFKNWTKVGDFSEETLDYSQGFGKHNLILNIGKKRFYIKEYFSKEGETNANVTVVEKSQWYKPWKCHHVKEFFMTGEQLSVFSK